MDDDCIPAPGCLERLVGRHAALTIDAPAFPLRIDAISGKGGFIPAWCGFLISRSLVAQIGLPRADLAWGADDTEYLQWRVHKAGLRPADEPLAVLQLRRVRGTSTKPARQIYYEVRNTVYFRVYLQRAPYRRPKRMFKSLVKSLGQIVMREGRKFHKLSAYCRGVFDGFTGWLRLRFPLGGDRGVD